MDKHGAEGKMIEEGIIDQIQKIFDHAKVELERINCPVHGQALKKLDFDRANGRFKIETCCEQGESLVNEGIAKL